MKKRCRITDLGSFVVDLMSYAPRLPTAGETVKGGPFRAGPGGKGSNQAIAARKCGADVTMITKLGQDVFADFAWNVYQQYGINTDYVYTDKTTGTGTALIIVEQDSAQNTIVVTPGACGNITHAEIDGAKNKIVHSDIFLTQLEINMDAIRYGLKIAFENHVRTILNPAPVQSVSDEIYKMISVITPNETEAALLSGMSTDTPEGVRAACRFFRKKGVSAVIVTLGKRGSYISSDEFEGMIGIVDAGNSIDTTGAGDAFNGGLAVALAEGKGIQEAAAFGAAVSGIEVTRTGTTPAMPKREEVDRLYNRFVAESKKLKDRP